MTVQSVAVGADPEILRVGIADGSFLLFRSSYLSLHAPFPVPGLEISPEIEAAYLLAARTYSAELSALRLIAIREHSRYLLSLKLRKRGFEEPIVRAVLEKLKAAGLLDDDRFVSLWLSSRTASRDEGSSKLLAGLLARGVSREAAERGLRERYSASEELSSARRFLEKRCIDISAQADEARRRLRIAGYSSRTIRDLFRFDEDES